LRVSQLVLRSIANRVGGPKVLQQLPAGICRLEFPTSAIYGSGAWGQLMNTAAGLDKMEYLNFFHRGLFDSAVRGEQLRAKQKEANDNPSQLVLS
jgi:hypothetical protein